MTLSPTLCPGRGCAWLAVARLSVPLCTRESPLAQAIRSLQPYHRSHPMWRLPQLDSGPDILPHVSGSRCVFLWGSPNLGREEDVVRQLLSESPISSRLPLHSSSPGKSQAPNIFRTPRFGGVFFCWSRELFFFCVVNRCVDG